MHERILAKTGLGGKPKMAYAGLRLVYLSQPSAQSFLDRLKTAAMRAGGPDALAKLSKVPRRTLGNYLAGRNEPKRPQLVDLARASNVSVQWLALGTGPMELVDRGQTTDDSGGMRELAPDFSDFRADLAPRFTQLPRYDVEASAGAGAAVHSEQIVDFLAFDTDWLKRVMRVDPKRLALITALGDSMTPTIRDGDLLLLDLSVDRVRDNAIYALRIGDALVVKRVQRRLDGGMRIISDNQVYPPDEVSSRDATELQIVGRVVWHGGML
jgi:phage repressor protein C with HTH and peptisase S24 domain